jgi:hypothetical protein
MTGDFPFESSPKSLYTLSDSTSQLTHLRHIVLTSGVVIGLERLKQLALNQILRSLTPQNVLMELSSRFAHKYDEVYEGEMKYTKEHWVSASSSPSSIAHPHLLHPGFHSE